MVDGYIAPVIVAGVMASDGNTSALVSEIAFLERAKSSPKKIALKHGAGEEGKPGFGAIGDLF